MKINLKDLFLIPNLISLFRLFLIIPFQIIFSIGDSDNLAFYLITLIFIAFFSDLLDGFLARKMNLISEMGKIIDPLADKVLIVMIVVNLLILNKLPLYFVMIILIRDILIFTGGIFLSKKIGKVLPSNILGKMTVFFIGISILLTIYGFTNAKWFANLILPSVSVLCGVSLIGYIIRAVETLKWEKNGVV